MQNSQMIHKQLELVMAEELDDFSLDNQVTNFTFVSKFKDYYKPSYIAQFCSRIKLFISHFIFIRQSSLWCVFQSYWCKRLACGIRWLLPICVGHFFFYFFAWIFLIAFLTKRAPSLFSFRTRSFIGFFYQIIVYIYWKSDWFINKIQKTILSSSTEIIST